MSKPLRRKAPRRTYDGHAGILFNGVLVLTPCLQLGEGGALIQGGGKLDKVVQGREMVITLFIPSIGGLVATATCVYVSDKKKVGLQFNALEMEYKKKVREFVSRRKLLEEVAP